MCTTINRINSVSGIDSVVYLVSDTQYISGNFLSGSELKFIDQQRKKLEKELVYFNRVNKWIFVQFVKKEENLSKQLENFRKSGSEIAVLLNQHKINKIVVKDIEGNTSELLALVEGMALSNYQFLKYKTRELDKITNSLETINIISGKVEDSDIENLKTLIKATFHCRDFVNEPVVYMTAKKFASEIQDIAAKHMIKAEVLNKKKIEALKMGGLLAVNKGSVEPPTFTILEWKPENYINEKPFVLVGKGVVYDTGGYNLKVHDYMNDMKCDMAGGAAVASATFAIAAAKLPIYLITLIPATDNRIDGKAIVSGDVITMANGTTVEVLNTDAEGRLILADALDYAKKFEPALVIDMATLTGSAMRAIGSGGMAGMQVNADGPFKELVASGYNTFERIAELPMWEEFGEEIKSSVADIKNIGGSNAGAITAGKFLEYFTDYPYIHLDIAGPAFLDKTNAYRTIGGSGVGVRLLFDFFKGISKIMNVTK
jgi:leucyl aminopeptidase